MEELRLSATERRVGESYTRGEWLDLRGAEDSDVRAVVLRHLLIGGGPSAPGQLAGLRLRGASITGHLDLSYTDIDIPISLRGCHLHEWVDLYGARLRRLSLRGSTLSSGFTAANADIAGGLNLQEAVVTERANLVGARIQGILNLDGARLSGSGGALDATHMTVTGTVLARERFVADGGIELGGASVGGSLRLSGATLRNPGGRALYAPGIRVSGVVDLTDGFRAEGSITFNDAAITTRLSLRGAELTDPEQVSLDLRNMVANEVWLQPRTPFPGRIDLGHARIGVLHDDPRTWPEAISLEGLVYQSLGGQAEVRERLRWMRRDPEGFRPQAYSQLAAVYQAAGRDDDARTVRYESERRRQRGPAARAWAALQDWTVGYGYKPVRAVLCLFLLLAMGTGVFSWIPPRAAEAPKAPEFHAAAYTADLLLPVVDLGQQSAYHARGWTAWVAYALIGFGLLFVTTAAAAIARRLQRG